MAKIKTALCDLTKNCFCRISSAGSQDWDLPQIFKSIWRPYPWKKNLLYQLLLYFFRLSPFHSECWYNIIFFQEDPSMDLASRLIWRFVFRKDANPLCNAIFLLRWWWICPVMPAQSNCHTAHQKVCVYHLNVTHMSALSKQLFSRPKKILVCILFIQKRHGFGVHIKDLFPKWKIT